GLLNIWPYACLGLLVLGLFGFVERLPFGAPREPLVDRLRRLEPDYWADRAHQQHSAALRPIAVGHSIGRPAVDEVGRQLQELLARFGLVRLRDLEQSLE